MPRQDTSRDMFFCAKAVSHGISWYNAVQVRAGECNVMQAFLKRRTTLSSSYSCDLGNKLKNILSIPHAPMHSVCKTLYACLRICFFFALSLADKTWQHSSCHSPSSFSRFVFLRRAYTRPTRRMLFFSLRVHFAASLFFQPSFLLSPDAE